MKRGDVVVMVAPGDLGKLRPGVLVQADELGDATSTLLVCPMSSDVRESPRMRPIVEPDAANGLRTRSQIMADKVLPVRRDRIGQVIGTLDTQTIDSLNRALLLVLGLAR